MVIIGRDRNYIIERDDTWEPGQHRLTATLHDQWYRDESAQWQAVDETIVKSNVSGFAHMAKAMAHAIHAKADGTRRWYPRRNVTTEYVEFGRPQYWTGSAWANLPLNTPTRTGSTLLWDQTNFSLSARINWHVVKLEIVLRNSAAARRVHWPVSLIGLTWDNWQLISGSTAVGLIHKPTAKDANELPIPINTSYVGGYVEFTADLTGAVYPIVIDPTFTTQPDATAGKDTWLKEALPNNNYGIHTDLMAVAGAPTRRRSLIRFDCSAIPTGAIVTAATLYLYVNQTASGTSYVYSVSAANADWVEGIGDDVAAVTGESCWNYKWYHPTTPTAWAGAAGLETSGTDYEAGALGSFVIVGSLAQFTEISTALTIARVQQWINDPNTNYGMLVRDGGFLDAFSSDYATAGYRPKLIIEYTIAVAVAGAITPTGALSRRPSKGSAGALTPTGAEIRQMAKPLVGAMTPSGSETRQTAKAAAGGVTPSGAQTRQSAKPAAGVLTPGGGLVRRIAAALAGALTPAGAETRQSGKSFGGSITPTGGETRQTAKAASGALTPAGTQERQANKRVVGSVTPSGGLLRQIAASLLGNIALAGALALTTAKWVAGTIAPVGALVKTVVVALAGALTPAGALAALKSVLLSIGGAVAPAGGLVRNIGKQVSGAIAPSGGLARLISRVIAGILSLAATLLSYLPSIRLWITLNDTAVTICTLSDVAVSSVTISDKAVTNITLSDT